MKIKKTDRILQREILEQKVTQWLPLRANLKPRQGWIKAIRGALGITSQQLADHMGIAQPNAMAMEAREVKGAITLETLNRAAEAMDCKLIYAIVPKEEFKSIDDLLNQRAREVANRIAKKVDHTMNLESQGLSQEDSGRALERIMNDLKQNADKRIWDRPKNQKKEK